MELAPLVRSPLRLRWHDEHFLAQDVDGQTVLDGVTPAAGSSAMITLRTVAGEWDVLRPGPDRVRIVLDSHGRSVARLCRRGVSRTEIVLPDEDPIQVSTPTFSLNASARVGDLFKASAPYLFPRRYVTLRFDDRFLSHRSRELVLALGALTAWGRIQTKIDSAADA